MNCTHHASIPATDYCELCGFLCAKCHESDLDHPAFNVGRYKDISKLGMKMHSHKEGIKLCHTIKKWVVNIMNGKISKYNIELEKYNLELQDKLKKLNVENTKGFIEACKSSVYIIPEQYFGRVLKDKINTLIYKTCRLQLIEYDKYITHLHNNFITLSNEVANKNHQLKANFKMSQFDLYGLYKQSTEGDNQLPAPSFLNFKAKSKWKSWISKKGLTRVAAMEQYIAIAKKIVLNDCLNKYKDAKVKLLQDKVLQRRRITRICRCNIYHITYLIFYILKLC